MKKTVFSLTIAIILLAAVIFATFISCASTGQSKTVLPGTQAQSFVNGKEIETFYAGLNAFIWGYPLPVMEQLQYNRVSGSTFKGGKKAPIPLNTFEFKERSAPGREGVPAPNNDTFFADAFLDLRKEPMLLIVPPLPENVYFSFQIIDAYQVSYSYIGTRATGNKGGTYAITGPDWKGKLPEGVTRIQSPDNLNQMLGRIGAAGKQGEEIARNFQKELVLVPLSYVGREGDYTPDQASSLARVSPDAPHNTCAPELRFFHQLEHALRFTRPRPEDSIIFDNLSYAGFTSDLRFDCDALDEAQKKGLIRAVQTGNALIDYKAQTGAQSLNGWFYSDKTGVFGTDYVIRAGVAKWYALANSPQEAIYMPAKIGPDTQKLQGKNNYLIHFPAGQLPPAKGFWSVTLYDKEGFFVPNPIERYSVGDRTEGLLFNPDGSLDVYIQNTDPGVGKNWLPSPDTEFYLIMRLYIPDYSLFNSSWKPPAIQFAPTAR